MELGRARWAPTAVAPEEVVVSRVGDELQSKREEAGMTLDDVRASLGIPTHYLEAMERGSSYLVADEFYLIPFLRRYADLLELDPGMIVSRFLAEAASEESSARVERVRPGNAVWLAGGSALLVLLVVAVWFTRS